MAIQSSGPISFSDLAAEFGDTKPYSFSEFYRDGGKVPGVNASVAASGAIRLGTFYGSVNELLQAVTANASINAQTIFGSDWGTNIPKRLSIPAGVTIGPLTIPIGMGGTLEVDVAGEIQGLGGSAGSAGGNAITASTSFTLNVLSGGAVRGGGGGGGLGGIGGGGSYYQAAGNWVVRNYNSGVNQVVGQPNWYHSFYWGGQFLGSSFLNASGYATLGGYDYKRGGSGGQSLGAEYASGIQRRTTAQTVNTNGGGGGAGGVGQGYNQSLSSGSGGAGGGTNAGTGGTGGSGGGFGSAGSTGATGANGNRTNGSGGSAGGAAGRAVLMNAGTVTVNNSGTINGAY